MRAIVKRSAASSRWSPVASVQWTAARLRPAAGLALFALFATPSFASAEERPRPRRVLGVGSAQGHTLAGGTLYTAPGRVGGAPHDPLFGLTLPTLELRYFPRPLYSLDLATSLSASGFAAAFDQSFYFTQDALVSFHLGKRVARFVGGPGIGYSVAFHEDELGVQNGASLRVVGQFGLELATKNEAFGFELVGRPWLELTHVQSPLEDTAFVSGGFASLVALWGYFRL